jgi:hypothetical protein
MVVLSYSGKFAVIGILMPTAHCLNFKSGLTNANPNPLNLYTLNSFATGDGSNPIKFSAIGE